MTPNGIVELIATGCFRGQRFKDILDKFMQDGWYQYLLNTMTWMQLMAQEIFKLHTD